MTDEEFNFSTGLPSEEMAAYLQMFLDETSEQLDALVEVLLSLEENPRHTGQLNEAFRLIHSIKGSSAMMGLDSITVLTHHLENHFERLRSGLQVLDRHMMDLVLRCIDFLRDCNQRLRGGQALASAPELLEELGSHTGTAPLASPPAYAPATESVPASPESSSESAVADVGASSDQAPLPGHHLPELPPLEPPIAEKFHWRVTVRFEERLPLADVKADLILQRLSALGVLSDSAPPPDQLPLISETRRLQVLLSSERPAAEIRAAADVGGVDTVEIDRDRSPLCLDDQILGPELVPIPESSPAISVPSPEVRAPVTEQTDSRKVIELPPPVAEIAASVPAGSRPAGQTAKIKESPAAVDRETPRGETASEGKSRVVETVRVDFDR
ncbi:MAG: Hpt domain-containing protein, partial [Planctomycetaceae bacterium]